MALIKFENEDKLFIKFFLLDASVNLNTWGVTRQAMLKGLKSFIGKPFVLTEDYGHPNASNGDDLLVQQEKYRVGDIIEVGVESRSGKAWGLAEITDSNAKDILKNGDVNFVSPSIVFNDSANVADRDGNSIITEFEGAHVAGVAEPAYGIDKAEIKGKCIGSKESCDLTLQKVEAKISECGNYLRVKRTKKVRNKKEAQDIDITMPRKRKDPVKTNTNKGKTQKELDEDYEVQMQSFEKDSVTEEEYKKYTSNKDKKSKKNNNMTKKFEEEKKDEEAESEDDEVKRGESLDDQYKDKEETDIMKSEEDKDEKDATDEKEDEEAEDEKDEKEADDSDKLDLTDKQKKFLKDSKLAKEVKVLRAELKALRSKIRKADIDPIIQDILDAKKLVGKVDARAEYRKLSKLDINTLRELQAHYDTIKEAKTQPRYVVKNASLDSSDKTGDSLLLSMRGDF